jgi:hypothetical protein
MLDNLSLESHRDVRVSSSRYLYMVPGVTRFQLDTTGGPLAPETLKYMQVRPQHPPNKLLRGILRFD